MNPLKVLMVAAEAAPYVTVGGAGSVVCNLSKSLHSLGVEVSIFVPKFGSINQDEYEMTMVVEGLKVPTDDEDTPYLICNVKSLKTELGITVYFLENQEYFEKRANVYGYSDDPTRFCLLSRGALEFIKTEKFVPDVIHCNDWHTGSVPNYLKTTYAKDPILNKISTVFTIHNLAYQGIFDHKHMNELDYDDGRSSIVSFFSKRLNTLNFMRRGILYADAVNTVSKAYAKEILTSEFGEGLDLLLLELKEKLFGIINGIDYKDFDPRTDAVISQNYDANSLKKRSVNKIALQKEYDLTIDPNTLLFGFVGRLDFQKGVDLMVRTLYPFLREYNAQFVQVGGGDWGLVELLNNLKKEFPTRVGVHTYPNFTLPRTLFAGCDAIIYPSRFEPCGIVQIEAMRYGSVPIVRNVGGLSDTVINFDSQEMTGNGFVFNDFDEFSLYGQYVRAYELHKNKNVWKRLQENGMKCDFSWEFSAKEYIKLYERALYLKERVHNA